MRMFCIAEHLQSKKTLDQISFLITIYYAPNFLHNNTGHIMSTTQY
jgi:hypothetical protein